MTARPSYRLLAAAFCLFAAGGRAAVADPVDFEPALPMLRTPFCAADSQSASVLGRDATEQPPQRARGCVPQPAEPKPPAPTVALQPAAVQPADSTVSDAARSRTAPTVPLRSATAVQSVSLSRDLAARDARLPRLPGYPADAAGGSVLRSAARLLRRRNPAHGSQSAVARSILAAAAGGDSAGWPARNSPPPASRSRDWRCCNSRCPRRRCRWCRLKCCPRRPTIPPRHVCPRSIKIARSER